MDRFSLFLHYGKQFIHGYLGVILIEARKEASLQIEPRIDGTRWKASEPIKGHSFESTDKQPGHDSIIICYITSLGPKVIDMLVRRTLTIIRM